ncbi:hypothetical protein OAE19_05120 [Porticoccaceae bacterium]|nr:hypothetical protein [Porticoccaceae bacterium]
MMSQLQWWKKDRFGWPIETTKGKRFKSAIRIIVQNTRKVISRKPYTESK